MKESCEWAALSDIAVFFFWSVATPQKKNKPAAHPPDVDQPRPDQAPMSSSPSSSSSSSTGTNSTGKGVTDSNPAVPNGILSPPSAATTASQSPPNSAATSIPSNNNGGGGGPQVAAAHNAPPAAAIAVPLSLTGAIIIIAGGLALHHRRQLVAAEKEHACQWSSSSWPWNKNGRSPGSLAALDLGGGGGSRDVEKTLFARALFRGATGTLPGHCTHDDAYHDHDRFLEKAADPLPVYSSYVPFSYASSAPEARQRTRQLDLFTREQSTTRPRPRPRAYPPPPSPSPSTYRGLWGRRYTLRRSTRSSNDKNNNTNGGGGGGSLWCSLSFAARHKKDLPPIPPHSALNSPAMTVVTSVTSEVLPSYLPSPQFDGPNAANHAHAGEHGATSVGDAGFENVPLSPPLPPPLHTRGEAADPDDVRMKELRGVYEAVARALGSTHRV